MVKRKHVKATDLSWPRHFAAHMLTLSTQANEQFFRLALTLDALGSMASEVESQAHTTTSECSAIRPHMEAVQRALKTEMRHQLKALALTIDALYVCAEKAATSRRH